MLATPLLPELAQLIIRDRLRNAAHAALVAEAKAHARGTAQAERALADARSQSRARTKAQPHAAGAMTASTARAQAPAHDAAITALAAITRTTSPAPRRSQLALSAASAMRSLALRLDPTLSAEPALALTTSVDHSKLAAR